MEGLIAEEPESNRMMQRDSSSGSSRCGGSSEAFSTNFFYRQLLPMGFLMRRYMEALAAAGNNVEEGPT
jgi:hypothetical protein